MGFRARRMKQNTMQPDIPQHVAKGIAEQHHARQAVRAKLRNGEIPNRKAARCRRPRDPRRGSRAGTVSIRFGGADSVGADEVRYFFFG